MSQYKQWDIQIFNKRTNAAIDDSTGVAIVMAGGTTGRSDLVTLKADQQGTALSQPVTLSSGRLTFYTAKTVTSVDITVALASGYAIYARGLSSSVHRLDVYPEDRNQLLVFPMLFNAGGTVVDTGIDLPVGCLIKDAYVWVGVVDATETVDIGFINAVEGGDENGLVAAASVANLGYVENAPAVSNGANIDSVGATTYGVLLASAITGSDAVATNGGFVRKNYLTDGTIKSVCYTPSSSDTFKGLGFIEYKLVSAAGL